MSKKKSKREIENDSIARMTRLPEPLASQQLGKYKESREEPRDLMDCKCGNTTFRVYVTIIIDDARLYCAKCNREHGL